VPPSPPSAVISGPSLMSAVAGFRCRRNDEARPQVDRRLWTDQASDRTSSSNHPSSHWGRPTNGSEERAFFALEYAPSVESTSVGQLVKVVNGGAARDGIVFDLPSQLKVVVAVVAPRRGPVFRTVHPKTLAERVEDGPDDPALRRLLRRTPLPARGGARGGVGAGYGRAGYTRAATHRPTGK
jgi:hypothetical protein